MRSERLRLLEDLGLNTPIFVVVSESNFEISKKFRKKCAIRFDSVEPPDAVSNALKSIIYKELTIESGTPPFIPHMSPCNAYHLFKTLSNLGASFKAHITDVTVKDSVGAGIALNIDNKIIVEATRRGTVREVSRRGKIDVRAKYVCDKLILYGTLNELLSYCIFRSAEIISKFHDSLIEWSCHQGRWGIKGDHIVVWEMYKVKSRDFNY